MGIAAATRQRFNTRGPLSPREWIATLAMLGSVPVLAVLAAGPDGDTRDAPALMAQVDSSASRYLGAMPSLRAPFVPDGSTTAAPDPLVVAESLVGTLAQPVPAAPGAPAAQVDPDVVLAAPPASRAPSAGSSPVTTGGTLARATPTSVEPAPVRAAASAAAPAPVAPTGGTPSDKVRTTSVTTQDKVRTSTVTTQDKVRTSSVANSDKVRTASSGQGGKRTSTQSTSTQSTGKATKTTTKPKATKSTKAKATKSTNGKPTKSSKAKPVKSGKNRR